MTITFIGGGNMAKALIGGLIKRGHSPSKMHVVEMCKEKCVELHNEFGVRTTTELAVAVEHGEVVILAVKPQQLQEVALQLAPFINGRLVISIAAGIRTLDLARWMGTQNIVRCMPNTPALIRCGATALYAMPAVRPEQCHRAESVLSAVGSTLWVDDEEMLDAVTAISGSGRRMCSISSRQCNRQPMSWGWMRFRRANWFWILSSVPANWPIAVRKKSRPCASG